MENSKHLQNKNSFDQDKHISFQEEGHVYTLKFKKKKIHPTSTTTVIHLFFPKFDTHGVISKMFKSGSAQKNYPGMTAEEIKSKWSSDGKEASELGTKMHYDIELYLNGEPPLSPKKKEFKMFLNFWKDLQDEYTGIKKFRTEWMIYDREHAVSGSIDFVAKFGKKLILIDWKRSKEIKMENKYEKGYGPCKKLDNCNYNHYFLQLNIYRYILEKNYGVKVCALMIVVLHPSQENYNCIPVPRKKVWAQNIFKILKEKNMSNSESSMSSNSEN